MPARKSTERESIGVEDLSLPRTMVQRLAKGVLPPNTQIQKDALLAISKSATVFVNYIGQRANENAISGNKKTIQPQDVMVAIKDLEFLDFTTRLDAELEKFTTVQNDKRNTYRRKVREQQIAAKSNAASEHLAGGTPNTSPSSKSKKMDDGEPATKKAKVDPDVEDDEDEDMDDTNMEDVAEGEDEPEDEEDVVEDDDEEEPTKEDLEDRLEGHEEEDENDEEEGDESD